MSFVLSIVHTVLFNACSTHLAVEGNTPQMEIYGKEEEDESYRVVDVTLA